MLDVFHGDRVDAGKRFVEQDELGIDGQRPGNLAAAALAARQLHAHALAHFLQAEFIDQLLEALHAVHFVKASHLHDGENVVFDTHGPEDRSFLGQVAHAFLGAAVHRKAGDFLLAEENSSGVGLDQPGDHIEAGGLAGAVRAEQADNFALLHLNGDAFDDRPFAVFLDQVRAK